MVPTGVYKLGAIAWIAVFLCAGALAAEPPALEFSVERFDVSGDNPLDAPATEEALAPFTGEHSGMQGLLAARDALTSALRAAGHTFHRVVLPPQTLAAGVVRLEVLTFALGDVRIRGNRHYSRESIARSLPGLAPGAQPDLQQISRALKVANQHPAKQLRLGFSASEQIADTLDAEVTVEDQKPWSVFANLNNIGNKATGHTRMSVGGQYADATGHDDVLSASFTFSPDNLDDVRQLGAFYQLPLYPLGGWVTAFVVDSSVDVGDVQGLFDISGSGRFVGIGFRRELIGVGRYRHSLTAGLQDRLFDTGISNQFTGQRINAISTKVRSRPFSVRYDGGYNWTGTSLDFYLDLTHNLSFGGHNRDANYRAVRPPADPGWKALRFGALVTQRLPWQLLGVARLTGQYADEPLIPGEQLGFGGDRSVRGFEQRTIAGDKGLQLNVEFWSPPIEALHGARLLAFFDGAHKRLLKPIAGQRPNDTISSVGIGARWQWRRNLTATLDYGQPLASADGEAADSGTSKIHFTLEYRH